MCLIDNRGRSYRSHRVPMTIISAHGGPFILFCVENIEMSSMIVTESV